MPDMEALKKAVIEASVSNDWNHAVNEWEVTGYMEDVAREECCICGQERLRHVYTITNMHNQNTITNIGSVCINKFERADLADEMECHKKAVELARAAREMGGLSKVPLEAPYYSKKLLEFFYENGAFSPSKYNGFDAFQDYEFMLKMFRKRTSPTEAQERKIQVLLKMQIRPFLNRLLRGERER